MSLERQETGTENASNRLILLVEDEVLIRIAAADVLRDEGYEVAEASNAAEALSLLYSGVQPHLVVSDIRMPGLIDGIALTYHLQMSHPGLPVLLASSHLPEGLDFPAQAFIQKPFATNTLLTMVARHLAKP